MESDQNISSPSNGTTMSPSSSLPVKLLVFIIILMVFEILTLLGNGFVVYLVALKRRLHTNTNWLVMSLAVSDLVVALAIIPSRTACFRHKCDEILMKILYDIFIFISLCNLCCLTLDRFIAVMQPLKYHSTITYSVVVKLIIASWVIPTIIFCIPLIWTYGYSDDIPLRQTADKIFYLTQIILFMCVPCLVMFVAYACILNMALKQAKRIQTLEKSVSANGSVNSYSVEAKNTIKVFGVVYVMFVFCWIMSAYRTFEHFFHQGTVPPEVTTTSRLLLLFNSCVNPIVYALWKKDIRAEFKNCFRSLRRRPISMCSNQTTENKAQGQLAWGEQMIEENVSLSSNFQKTSASTTSDQPDIEMEDVSLNTSSLII